MRFVRSNNFVMATEQAPAQFRPGNQARLIRARARNPSHAEADAFAPNPGEARSGNMVGDNGLTKRSFRVHDAILRGSKTLAKPQMTQFTVPMPDVGGAPPRQLQAPSYRSLTVPMPPADVRGMDGMEGMDGLDGLEGWGRRFRRMRIPLLRKSARGPAEFHPNLSFRNHAMTQVQPAAGPAVALPDSAATALMRPEPVTMQPPADVLLTRRVGGKGVDATGRRLGSQFGKYVTGGGYPLKPVNGLGELHTPSLMLAAAALVGVYFLVKNRRTA